MKKHIIVCDDDESILNVIKDILEEEDYKVTVFTNCGEIVNNIEKYSPDLFILDIWMPKMDAKEAVHILRSNNQSKKIPIILISALNEGVSIGRDLKVEGFLKKPFNVLDLLAIVEKNLANKQSE